MARHPDEDVQPPKVTWVAVDDWHAIYVNGALVGEQGHSLSPWTWLDVLRALGAEVEDLRYSEVASVLAEEQGRFPDAWPPAEQFGSYAPAPGDRHTPHETMTDSEGPT